MPERNAVVFLQPQQVEVRQESIPEPQAGQALVRALYSAISPGTEMLIYRGQFPTGLAVDESLAALNADFAYPLEYGYALVGQVEAVGAGVDAALLGERVFAFQPHGCHFTCAADELKVIPTDIEPQDALFLSNMETAVSFVMDGAPLLGEGVVVFGQGIVGLLTVALLRRLSLAALVTFDCYDLRRKAALEMGVSACFDPTTSGALDQARNFLPHGADLAYEISGAPQALDDALALTGYAGRVVIGSWYGAKPVALNLGGRFHRSRIRLISSQVSTLAPELRGRWTKERRFDLAWEMIRQVQPARWITHTFALTDAPASYRLIDQHPAETIQVILSYENLQ